MYNYNTVTFQDQLKFLINNLEQGAGLFTTDEGRKAHFNSLLVEIKHVNLIMRHNIQLIQDNNVLFPSQSQSSSMALIRQEETKGLSRSKS